MLKRLEDKKFPIESIIEQVSKMDLSNKRIELNKQNGKFFNDPWVNTISGTPLGDVLDSLGNIGQARLLTLYAGDTYTAHTDPDDRYHLAITTNQYSFLGDLDKQKFYNVPVDGNVWYMDTSPVHIAVNWGPNIRTHLNVRLLLPHFYVDKPNVKLEISDNKTEWKQESYIELMGFVNRGIKSGIITGFDAPNQTTLYLNTTVPELLTDIFDRIKQRGVDIEVTYNQ